jgi:hypothetical protein
VSGDDRHEHRCTTRENPTKYSLHRASSSSSRADVLESRISAVLDAQNAWFGAVRTEQIDRRNEREQSFWDEAIRSVIDGGGEMPDRT